MTNKCGKNKKMWLQMKNTWDVGLKFHVAYSCSIGTCLQTFDTCTLKTVASRKWYTCTKMIDYRYIGMIALSQICKEKMNSHY